MDPIDVNTADLITSYLTNSGKYSDLAEISGGMNGYAYKATHAHLGRQVFVKVVHFDETENAAGLTEVQNIVEVTESGSAHQNIVAVYDCEKFSCASDRFLCFQMEYIDGNNFLQEREAGRIGQQDAIRLALGVLNGLAHLHHARFLHRDLKPHNIMISANVPKISDFGSSARIPGGGDSVKASRHSALYVPPEGWATPSVYTMQSDVYQVGVVLYEFATGHLNYDTEHYLTKGVLSDLRRDGKTYSSLDACDQARACDRGIAELARKGKLLTHGKTMQPYLSPHLLRIIRLAANPEPDKRFSSATDFRAALLKLNVPNWKLVQDGEFFADDWAKHDWQVRLLQSKKNKIEVSKRKTGCTQYRTMRTSPFASLEDAFKYIESESK